MQERELEAIARTIFGEEDPESIQRWVAYWLASRRRNERLLRSFCDLALIDFTGKRVLDLGCGTGGMAEEVGPRCGFYVGADYHRHVIRFAPRAAGRGYVQCSGTRLPFPDRTFDYVAAFDVIEHVAGGLARQKEFLREIRRTLRPRGMALLTTPNRWHPREGHTGLLGPQYLPRPLRDRYIAWRNPGFLREHRSFDEIPLLSPRALRQCLKESGLRFLHELPCGLDRDDYRRLFPWRAPLAYLGLGWWPHAEFWGLLVRREDRAELRLKLRKNWDYELKQPAPAPPGEFRAEIDFDRGHFNHQLGEGWYWHERDVRGFRWTRRSARCYLETRDKVDFLRVEGYSPRPNRLSAWVDGALVGVHEIHEGENFRLRYLLPFRETSNRLFRVDLACDRVFRPDDAADPRRLGVMVFSTGVAA